MSRNQLLWIAVGLAIAASACMGVGLVLLNRDVSAYIVEHYPEYAHDANGTHYACTDSPKQTADAIAHYKPPSARASNAGTEYLRYSRFIVIVSKDGARPCSIRLESINAGYSHGSYIFLGPGFTPGSPSGGSGGRPGGPGGSK